MLNSKNNNKNTSKKMEILPPVTTRREERRRSFSSEGEEEEDVPIEEWEEEEDVHYRENFGDRLPRRGGRGGGIFGRPPADVDNLFGGGGYTRRGGRGLAPPPKWDGGRAYLAGLHEEDGGLFEISRGGKRRGGAVNRGGRGGFSGGKKGYKADLIYIRY